MFTGRGVVLDSCSKSVLRCYLSDLQASLRHSHIVAHWLELTTAVCSFERKGRKERDTSHPYSPKLDERFQIGTWSCRCTFASVSSWSMLSVDVICLYLFLFTNHISQKTVLTRYTLLHWKDEWVSKSCFCSSWSSSQSMVHLSSHCIFSVGNFSMLPSRKANPPCICPNSEPLAPPCHQPSDTLIGIFQSFQPALL